MFQSIHQGEQTEHRPWIERMHEHQRSIVKRVLGTIPADNDAQKIAKRIREWETGYFLFIDGGMNGMSAFFFRPIHLVYLETGQAEPWGRFILGAVPAQASPPQESSDPYALLNEDRIQKAAPSGKCFAPVKSIHIQPVNNTCLEFLLSYEYNDTILVFANDDNSLCGEYSLLSRLDIYPPSPLGS